jgi:hypothetical protein
MANITGFDPTPGTWTVTLTQSGASFAFGSTAAPNVPDGGMTLMLLGSALTGLALIRRKI